MTQATFSVLPPAQPVPSSSTAPPPAVLSSPKSTSRATSNGLVIKFAGRNGGGASSSTAMAKKVSEGDPRTAARPTKAEKGKGKEVDSSRAAPSTTDADTPMEDLQFGGVVPTTQFVPPPTAAPSARAPVVVPAKRSLAIPPFKSGSSTPVPVEKEKRKPKKAAAPKEKEERVILPLRESNSTKTGAKAAPSAAAPVVDAPKVRRCAIGRRSLANRDIIVDYDNCCTAAGQAGYPFPSLYNRSDASDSNRSHPETTETRRTDQDSRSRRRSRCRPSTCTESCRRGTSSSARRRQTDSSARRRHASSSTRRRKGSSSTRRSRPSPSRASCQAGSSSRSSESRRFEGKDSLSRTGITRAGNEPSSLRRQYARSVTVRRRQYRPEPLRFRSCCE